jgi:hypothetical protein
MFDLAPLLDATTAYICGGGGLVIEKIKLIKSGAFNEI